MFNSWRINKKATPIQDNSEPNISTKIPVSVTLLKDYLNGSSDITFRDININKNEVLTICYVEGLINTNIVDENILKPIINHKTRNKDISVKDIYSVINDGLISHTSYESQSDISKCIDGILLGNICIIGNKENTAFLFEVKGFEKRSIQPPTEENVLKGSKDSFIEVLRVNTALIRRKIKSTDLRIKERPLGKDGKTTVAIIYIERQS